MSGTDPKGWGDRFLSFCLAVLGGVIALSIAVAVLKFIMIWLLGALGLAVLIWLGVVVYRATRDRW
ncbi:hypothetical protein [Nocardia blacklockiae]|uniref:hypothetical protein n=1 Tax=Nocardia blacklockiae TaxID=480036 RepID=UPI0018959329|nr:hypothetical protein [Nocardia blacklockiae]MBF6171290.1 hypothetical protein [Nocardia blacklockiae]